MPQPPSQALSDVAARIVRAETEKIVPRLVDEQAERVKEKIFEELLERISTDDLLDALSARYRPKVNYFGGQARVGRINADSVDFVQSGAGAVSRPVQDKLRDLVISSGDFSTAAQAYTAGGIFSKVDGADANTWLWTRKLTGTPSIGAGTLNGYTSGYHFDIYTDDANLGTDFSVGMRVRQRFGGSSAQGGRIGLYGSVELISSTSSSNGNRNYVGVQGSSYATANDGGTNTGAGAKGGVFGAGAAAYAPAAATNLTSVTGLEVNTFTATGASAKYISGAAIIGCDAVRGATLHAAIDIGAQGATGGYGAHVGWKWGIVFTDEHGADPFYASSTLIGTQFQSTKTVLRGIDFSQFTMTEYILRGVKTILRESQLTLGDSGGNAIIDVDGASANASLLVRAKGTGSVYLQGGDGTSILRGDGVASSVNLIAIVPAVTTGSPAVAAVGSDTNVDLVLQGQGTGLLRFGTFTGSGDVVCNGSISIKDAAGNTRKLMTTA